MSSIWSKVKAYLFGRVGAADRPDTEAGKSYENALMAGAASDALPPWPLFKLGAYFNAAPMPPAVRAAEDSMAFFVPVCLGIVCRLNVADVLGEHGGGMNARQIADSVGCPDVNALARVLRTLHNVGYFECYYPGKTSDELRTVRLEDRLWRNNARSVVLRADHPKSVRALIVNHVVNFLPATPLLYDSMMEAKAGAQQRASERGEEADADAQREPEQQQPREEAESTPAFERFWNVDFWQYLSDRPDCQATFNAAMRVADSGSLGALIADYDWSRYMRMIDVGGADGTVCESVLKRHALKAVIFDLPHVIEHAVSYWNDDAKRAGMVRKGRVSFARGDFFQPDSIPSARAGDVYVLRNVLHDWRTADCVNIVQHIRRAIGDTRSVKLAVLEFSCDVAPSGSALERMRSRIDQVMLVAARSAERTEREFADILRRGGFELTRVLPTRSAFVVFEAEPVYA